MMADSRSTVSTALITSGFLFLLSLSMPGDSRADDGEASVGSALARPEQAIDQSLIMMETFSAATEAQLKSLAELISRRASGSADAFERVAVEEIQFTSPRPAQLRTVFQDSRIRVLRAVASGEPRRSGQQELMRALEELTLPYGDSESIHVKFKTFRVYPADNDLVATHAYFHAWGADEKGGVVEQTAEWRLRWSVVSTNEPPRLAVIEVSDFEEVATREGRGPAFSDCTLAAFEGSPVFDEQLRWGIEHWRRTLPADTKVDFRGHHGIAIGDVNGDDLEDIYLCQPRGLPDRLFVQTPAGTVRDISREAGLDWLDASKSALFADLDNDGDQDLVVCIQERILVMANDGRAHFRLTAELDGPLQPHSVTSADYDNDGKLDLYVCGFWLLNIYEVTPLRAAFALPTPWHDANNGAPNMLYRNEGEFRFRDVTADSGLDQNNTRFSHAAGWEDFDKDGDQDLYVANDYGRNNLYRNDDGRFVDVAADTGVEDQAAGMSVAWSDFNKDGWMDLYVSNMFSSAGGRISFHSKFQEKLRDELRGEFRRHARGNTLFRNSPDQSFVDVSETAAVVLGRWAWSSNFIDINNDGLDDLFVTNGFVTNEDTKDL